MRKTMIWADRINTRLILCQDAWYYNQATIKNSIKKPMTTTTLT